MSKTMPLVPKISETQIKEFFKSSPRNNRGGADLLACHPVTERRDKCAGRQLLAGVSRIR